MILLIGIGLVWIVFVLRLAFYSHTLFGDYSTVSAQTPFVSIIIAIRNEEKHIPQLMKSLKLLDYPKSKYEVLIGDDDSQDHTLALAKQLSPSNAIVHHFEEKENFGKLHVMAALAKKCKGEYLLFTDADMTFNPKWIYGMLVGAKHCLQVGMTQIVGDSLNASMQNMDWLFHEVLLSYLSNQNIQTTAWGNNMIIDHELYAQIGGLEAIQPTIVEDVALMRSVLATGGIFKINLSQVNLVTTQSVGSFTNLLQQRLRWMSTIKTLPIGLKIGLLIKVVYLPSIILLTIKNPIFWILPFIKVAGSKYLFKQIGKVTKSNFSIPHLLLYEIYDFVFYLINFIAYLLPIQVNWKGRKYHKTKCN